MFDNVSRVVRRFRIYNFDIFLPMRYNNHQPEAKLVGYQCSYYAISESVLSFTVVTSC